MITAQDEEYGVIKATPSVPIRDLLRVPHKGGVLIVSYPAFGLNAYAKNLTQMQKKYSHSEELPRVSFRPSTSSEAISVVAYNFGKFVKPYLFDSRWLQFSYIIRTQEGVFVNPPKNPQGNPITDEKTLKSFLNGAEETFGIYLGDNDFGFAPYETFKQGVQNCDTFSESGLARVLEHTQERIAKNLREISSPKNYKKGVKIEDFDRVKDPVLRVASLDLYLGLFGDERLDVGGDYLDEDYDGYAFGVLDETTIDKST